VNTFLWGALPYAAAVLLIPGLIWRRGYDQYGWTTRSSEIYERKILDIASTMFHYGISSSSSATSWACSSRGRGQTRSA
jgi:nitrate reductase gamma subunit